MLTAICEEKVRLWFDAYKKTRVTSTRERLNVLLRCTQPFRPEEEDFLFMLLRLRSRGECAVMEGALRGAQRELVKPEIENLLMILGETGRRISPGLDWKTWYLKFTSPCTMKSAKRCPAAYGRA